MDIRQILCPVDFSDASAHAVDQAVELARWYGARMTALHVDTAVADYPDVPALEPAERQRLQDRMTTFCQAATAAGVAVDLRVVSGHPLAAILDQAASLPADLIVIGTHGVSGFQHLVLGSRLRRVGCEIFLTAPGFLCDGLPVLRPAG